MPCSTICWTVSGDFVSSLVIAVKGSVAVSSVPGGGAAMGTMAIPAFGSPSIAYINGGGILSAVGIVSDLV